MSQLVSDVTKVLNYKESKKNVETERQKILANMAKDENNKTNLIKKVLAKQRVEYGATGNTGSSISEKAVLKRLREETAAPYDAKRQENVDKITKLKAKKPNLVKSWLSGIDKIAG